MISHRRHVVISSYMYKYVSSFLCDVSATRINHTSRSAAASAYWHLIIPTRPRRIEPSNSRYFFSCLVQYLIAARRRTHLPATPHSSILQLCSALLCSTLCSYCISSHRSGPPPRSPSLSACTEPHNLRPQHRQQKIPSALKLSNLHGRQALWGWRP